MDKAAPAAAGAAAEEKRPLLRRVPTSLIVTLLGIAISAWLIPAFTRQWDDRQKAHELKAAVLSEIAAASASAFTDAHAMVQRDVSSERSQISRARAPSQISPAERAWVAAYLKIDATLAAYFPKQRPDWLTYANLVDRMLARAAGARELGIPFVLKRRELVTFSEESFAPLDTADAVYAMWRSDNSKLWVTFRTAERNLAYYGQGLLVREINTAHPVGYSTSIGDLLHDLIP